MPLTVWHPFVSPAALAAAKMAKPVLAYIGLGSNMKVPHKQLAQAIKAIAKLPSTELKTKSPLYTTAPIGNIDQADFINGVVSVTTTLSAINLLRALLTIESQQGRSRDIKWGPRSLDLDLLFYGEEQWHSLELSLPHPRIGDRKFVLQPLYDINPDLELNGRPIKHYLTQCERQTIRPFTPPPARD